MTDAAAVSALSSDAERIRRSGVLGRPGQLTRLFDFLVERSADADPPSETDIASEVFNRGREFIPGQDAVVRVNIHRLRKRLDDFYLRHGFSGPDRLALPRGEYRLVVEAAADGETGDPTPAQTPAARTTSQDGLRPASAGKPSPDKITISRRSLFLGAAGLGVAHLAGWGAATYVNSRPKGFLGASPWSVYERAAAPLLIVLGDYYIFGDTDEKGQVLRLTREFFINSRDELYQYMMENDDLHYRYMDLDLRYLPTSVATALQDLAPLMARHPSAQIIGASQVSPQMLRDHDVVYVGYLSGLGPVRHPAFRGGRLTVGASFDQIIDHKAGRTYDSEAALVPPPQGLVRDYGYFTRFPGPTGNTISIIAGARDIGLSGVAEAVTSPTVLKSLPRIRDDQAIEVLFEVEGQNGANLKTKLLVAQQRDPSTIWTATPLN